MKKVSSFSFRTITITSALICILLFAGVALAQTDPGFGGDPFEPEEVSPLISFIAELHPLAVHFPLALALAALFFEAMFLISKNQRWQVTGVHTLTLGAAISLATIFTGLIAGTVGPFLGPDADLVDLHRLLGLTSSGLLLLTTYLAVRARKQMTAEQANSPTWLWTYRAGLIITNISVFTAGHFGAKLSGLGPF